MQQVYEGELKLTEMSVRVGVAENEFHKDAWHKTVSINDTSIVQQ
jgi:hypothetical protein